MVAAIWSPFHPFFPSEFRRRPVDRSRPSMPLAPPSKPPSPRVKGGEVYGNADGRARAFSSRHETSGTETTGNSSSHNHFVRALLRVEAEISTVNGCARGLGQSDQRPVGQIRTGKNRRLSKRRGEPNDSSCFENYAARFPNQLALNLSANKMCSARSNAFQVLQNT